MDYLPFDTVEGTLHTHTNEGDILALHSVTQLREDHVRNVEKVKPTIVTSMYRTEYVAPEEVCAVYVQCMIYGQVPDNNMNSLLIVIITSHY